jgi:hypothetical protein
MKNVFKENLMNFLLFQIVWFISVFCIVSDMSFVGFTLIGIVAIFYSLISKRPQQMFLFYLLAALVGFVIDTLLINSGAVQLISPLLLGDSLFISSPIMVMFWVNFVTTFDYSLSWLQPYKWWGAILGSIGGPWSYYAGFKLGALHLGDPMIYSLLSISLAWFLSMPILQIIFQGVYKK